MLVWILATGVPDFCYARTLAFYRPTSYLSISVYCIRSLYSENTPKIHHKVVRKTAECSESSTFLEYLLGVLEEIWIFAFLLNIMC